MDLAKLREKFGLSADLSDDEVMATLLEAGVVTAQSPETGGGGQTGDSPADDKTGEKDGDKGGDEPKHRPGTGPSGNAVVTIDREHWDDMQRDIAKLKAISAKQQQDERDRTLARAVEEGKFAASRLPYWTRLWEADPEGTRDTIASLQKFTVPINAIGTPEDGSAALADAEFADLWPAQGRG